MLPDIWHLCKPGVPGPGLHHHASVHLEQAEPQRQDEFLWPAELPGALLALGADGILSSAGQLHHRGSSRCPTWLLLSVLGTSWALKGRCSVIERISLILHIQSNLFCYLFPSRYCCGSCVFLPGGCFSQPARWRKVVKNSVYHVSFCNIFSVNRTGLFLTPLVEVPVLRTLSLVTWLSFRLVLVSRLLETRTNPETWPWPSS